jgi:hypothetical protein
VTITTRTDIISETNISFMRANSLSYAITNAKPGTRLYGFFDGESIDAYLTPARGVLGAPVVTDSSGQATGTFSIPDFHFINGNKVLKFQDTPTFVTSDVPGSLISSAESVYSTAGIDRVTRDTATDTTTIVTKNTIVNNVIGALGDPLAQSFFTHGVDGGVDIGKIDIYFQSKEANGGVPVSLEIRELQNGYPSPKLASKNAVVVKRPENVSVSADGSVPTTFVFDLPIHLPQDRDWCFVLKANSSAYQVWTAKLGERSQETGLTIYSQPFVGTMFKSENDVTWTTDSTEDIKFTIHKAVYDTSAPETLVLRAKANAVLIYGRNVSVVTGSNTMTIKFDHLHGLRNGDRLRIDAPANSLFRGISSDQLTGSYIVTYIDEYHVSAQLAAGAFNSTGVLDTPGIVNAIQVDAGGSGYTVTPTIAINGTCTTPATATVQTAGGVITGVTVTNPGVGYTAKPTFALTGNGSGASLFLISETVFQVETNRVYDEAVAKINFSAPGQSMLKSALKTTDNAYLVQNPYEAKVNVFKPVGQNSILLSTGNNTAFLPGQNPTELSVTFSSSNPNVSPKISLSETPKLEMRAYLINNQTQYETIDTTALAGSASVLSATVNVGGASYTSTAITVSAPDQADGVQATAVAVLASGIVTGVTITDVGSGYTKPPVMTMTQTVATPAVLVPVLSAFNTELATTGGSAKSRYVTKPITLETVSTGIKVTVLAYSPVYCSFDLYIRTSLRSDITTHTSLGWKMLHCDVSRNQSTKPGDYRDYDFYLDGIAPFDVYDLKIVLRSSNVAAIPCIANYRAIVLAT